MQRIYRHDNYYSEFVEIWKEKNGYNITEYVYNGTDYLGLYEIKKPTLPEVNQFILDIWFRIN